MRLPFPVRVPFKGACVFACILMMVQLAEGTAPLFAICSFLFVVVASAAFNLAGGFSRPSGAYVFFYALLAVILGLCTKAFLGEPADSNLLVPERTILVFLAGICAMYGAVFLSVKMRPAKGILEDVVTDRNMQNATVGCMVTGFIAHAVMAAFPRSDGSFVGAMAQVNNFLPMAVIIGTIYQIRKSGGTSSVNLPVLLAGGDLLFFGLAGFSKQGIFTPLLCWLVAAASQRYRMSRLQTVGVVAAVAFMIVYIVPYAQYGRNYEDEVNPSSTKWETMTYLLGNLGYVREQYKASFRDQNAEKAGDYFGTDVGFFDRLQMIGPDDKLINTTENTGQFGMLPIYMGFGNLVPHFIWANKPLPISGNTYAREIGGIIADEDTTTGISFSPSGEAYHLERWLGVLILAPVLWIMLFTLFDSLCGDTRLAPWGLLMVVYFGHIAPEGMLGSVIYSLGYTMVAVVVAALSAAYVMPILGSLIKGPERTTVQRIRPVRSVPRRSPTLPSSGSVQ